MTFLASTCSKTLLKMQQSQLQYQKNLLMFRTNEIARQMSNISSQYNSSSDEEMSPEDDPYYQQLQKISEIYEQQSAAIDAQLTIVDNEVQALTKLITDGIKASCTMTIGGGS